MDYSLDSKNGVIIDQVTRDRCIIMTKARLQHLLSRITEIFQSGAQVIVTEACKSAGEHYIAEIQAEKITDMKSFLKTAAQRFTDAGLGRVEIIDFNLEKQEFKFRVWNNFFAEMPNGESTYCNCVAAFVTGMYRGFLGKIPNIKEIKCIGRKDAYCEWHLSP